MKIIKESIWGGTFKKTKLHRQKIPQKSKSAKH